MDEPLLPDDREELNELLRQIMKALRDPSPQDSTLEPTYQEPPDKTLPITKPYLGSKDPLWVRLAAEGNDTLIRKLRHVEIGTPGFSTIIIPDKGFSNDPNTHNDVLDWLRSKSILIYSVDNEARRLTKSLLPSQ